MSRSRTIRWADPAVAANRMQVEPGRHYVEGLWNGAVLPSPMMEVLRTTVSDVDDTDVRLVALPGPEHENPFGAIHGGYLTAVLGTASACSVLASVGPNTAYTVRTMTATQERVVTVEDAPLIVTARVVGAHGDTVTTEAAVVDGADRRVGSATTVFLLLGN